jgi:hypothetical protein
MFTKLNMYPLGLGRSVTHATTPLFVTGFAVESFE